MHRGTVRLLACVCNTDLLRPTRSVSNPRCVSLVSPCAQLTLLCRALGWRGCPPPALSDLPSSTVPGYGSALAEGFHPLGGVDLPLDRVGGRAVPRGSMLGSQGDCGQKKTGIGELESMELVHQNLHCEFVL
jgi:hypothetical protein